MEAPWPVGGEEEEGGRGGATVLWRSRSWSRDPSGPGHHPEHRTPATPALEPEAAAEEATLAGSHTEDGRRDAPDQDRDGDASREQAHTWSEDVRTPPPTSGRKDSTSLPEANSEPSEPSEDERDRPGVGPKNRTVSLETRTEGCRVGRRGGEDRDASQNQSGSSVPDGSGTARRGGVWAEERVKVEAPEDTKASPWRWTEEGGEGGEEAAAGSGSGAACWESGAEDGQRGRAEEGGACRRVEAKPGSRRSHEGGVEVEVEDQEDQEVEVEEGRTESCSPVTSRLSWVEETGSMLGLAALTGSWAEV